MGMGEGRQKNIILKRERLQSLCYHFSTSLQANLSNQFKEWRKSMCKWKTNKQKSCLKKKIWIGHFLKWKAIKCRWERVKENYKQEENKKKRNY